MRSRLTKHNRETRQLQTEHRQSRQTQEHEWGNIHKHIDRTRFNGRRSQKYRDEEKPQKETNNIKQETMIGKYR